MSDTAFKFDEENTLPLVLEYQKTRCEIVLAKILDKCDDMIRRKIFSSSVWQFMELEEIVSLIKTKIWRGLPLYKPSRAPLFSFLTNVIQNKIKQIQIDTAKAPRQPSIDDEEFLWDHPSESKEAHGIDDISDRMMRAQTICTDACEVEAQRWLVKSFIASEFNIKRHVAANAMASVYNVPCSRSRELHDYTLLEVRRALLTHAKPPDIKPSDLIKTRQKTLRKYSIFLTKSEFNRLAFLMKNLSVTLIDNVYHVINGYPDSRPLFPDYCRS
jgi:hypothetical protein